MYNPNFSEQMADSRVSIFGGGCIDTREISADEGRRYVPPPGVEILRCHRDINGEWVPEHVGGLSRTLKE